jgi:predicted acetyltransferase
MLPADFRVARVDRSADEVLGNLFEHYSYDMAEWFDIEINSDGRYSYPIERIWSEGTEVFLAYSAELPIGFALVGSARKWIGEGDVRDLHEFFVIRRHRRHGVGQALANHVWGQYPGAWLVRVYHRNLPALPFWRRAIASFTANRFQEEVRTVEDRQWSYFRFASGNHPVA